MSSNWGQAEGRFEARIKLPQPARYVWPAFWLLPQSNPDGRHSTDPAVSRCWPTGGEIDILESVGQYKNDRYDILGRVRMVESEKTVVTQPPPSSSINPQRVFDVSLGHAVRC